MRGKLSGEPGSATHTQLKIGSDRVVCAGPNLLVYSKVDTPDWSVRRYRQTVILFRETRYRIAEKARSDGRLVRYVLEPFPETSPDLPGKIIRYDEDYASSRDAVRRRTRSSEFLRFALWPLLPAVGFLYRSTKARLEDRYGISSRDTTVFSLYLEFFCFLFGGILVTLHSMIEFRFLAVSNQMMDPTALTMMAAVSLMILADLIMRFSALLEGTFKYYGFYEWLFRPQRKS